MNNKNYQNYSSPSTIRVGVLLLPFIRPECVSVEYMFICVLQSAVSIIVLFVVAIFFFLSARRLGVR